MKPAFVVDCSITMAWCFADEATAESSRLLDRLARESVIVPSLWFLEVSNVLAMAEKRKRITPARSTEFLVLLSTFDVVVDSEAPLRAFAELLPLCRSHALTTYDAVYLELAIRRMIPLATLDRDLRAAAKSLGLALLGV